MAKSGGNSKQIIVYADWVGLNGPIHMGMLQSEQLRGKEVFSFAYSREWLKLAPALQLDPDFGHYSGPQFIRDEKPNFGIFMDSSPDRWGKVLMERREALQARKEDRRPKSLTESDFLLGVYDLYRMGGLRFRLNENGPFLNNDEVMAAPPIASLRTLEEASLQLEKDDAIEDPAFSKWLSLLISPGSSLGGARPKASVIDPEGQLWIAKFPSRKDERNMGAWEFVVNELAIKAGLLVAEGRGRKFSHHHHTYLTKRFDRNGTERIHFASAMTLLGYNDGADAMAGVSYLQLAEFIMRHGATPEMDLVELWRRIVFYVCISNSDDHLRNHGFLLTSKGWKLSPAFDINPIPRSTGLSLNISEESNALDLDLCRDVAEKFRVDPRTRESIITTVKKAVSQWQMVAHNLRIAKNEMLIMESAFQS